jgi:hypothetical protein
MTAHQQSATVPERLAANADLRCTYRACPDRPIRRMTRSDGDCSWWGCARHWPAMLTALHHGLPGSTTGTGWVEVIELDTTHPDQEATT